MDLCWLHCAFAALAARMRSLAVTKKLQIAVSQLLESELLSRQQAGWKVNFGAGRLEKCVVENSMHSHQAVIYFLAFILNKESDSARLESCNPAVLFSYK